MMGKKNRFYLHICGMAGKREHPVSVILSWCTSDLAPEPQTVSHHISHAPPDCSDHHLRCSAALFYLMPFKGRSVLSVWRWLQKIEVTSPPLSLAMYTGRFVLSLSLLPWSLAQMGDDSKHTAEAWGGAKCCQGFWIMIHCTAWNIIP